jgi:hypothetical protein
MTRASDRTKISADEAPQTATDQYPGEVEEVKSVLMADGHVLYEVDVEAEDDAETGRMAGVDIEYWAIGPSGEGEKGNAENVRVGGAGTPQAWYVVPLACDVSSCRRARVLKRRGGLRPQCLMLFAA